MARSASYWKKRFAQLEQASHTYGLSVYAKIEFEFEKAQREVQKEIESWYGRFAKNNSVSMQEARKMLTASELKELKWDVQQYIKYGQENAVDAAWAKALENASAKVHISRLEALQIRIQQAAEVAFGNELDAVDAMARKVYSDAYYHSIFEVQKGMLTGWEIGQIDDGKLRKIITKPWASDGRNFSDRIWQSKSQLVDALHTQLTRNCILGKAPDDAIRAISNQFNVSKKQAGRLVMTEEAYFHSEAQKDAFYDLDVEAFEIVAALDSHTSDICREMDGKHFPMSVYEAGVTAPPFHPWCRSVTVPYFEDDFGQKGQRAARGADGKTYYIPNDMTYKDWEQNCVVDAAPNADKDMYERYKSVLGDLSPKSLEDFVEIKYNNRAEWERLKYQYRTLNRYEVDGNVPAEKIIELDNAAYYTKQKGFSYANLTGDARRQVKSLYKEGNAAAMEFEGVTYFAHSRAEKAGTVEYDAYIGKYPIIGLKENRLFTVKDIGDGILRENDTEAKFLEFVATQKHPGDTFTVTILSEKHICESCQGVVKQFRAMFPNATVNIISGKRGYNHSTKGTHTWKHRKRVK